MLHSVVLRTLTIVVATWALLVWIMSPWAYALMLVEPNDIRLRSILVALVALVATRLVTPHYLVAALTMLGLVVVNEALPLGPLDDLVGYNNLQAPVFFALTGAWAALTWGQFRRTNEGQKVASVAPLGQR